MEKTKIDSTRKSYLELKYRVDNNISISNKDLKGSKISNYCILKLASKNLSFYDPHKNTMINITNDNLISLHKYILEYKKNHTCKRDSFPKQNSHDSHVLGFMDSHLVELQNAILLLKKQGYKVYKPITEFKEI